jgi:phosphatidylserine decarboxylase
MIRRSLAAWRRDHAFHLGSTVVLIFESGRVELLPSIKPDDPVRLGMPIGRVI